MSEVSLGTLSILCHEEVHLYRSFVPRPGINLLCLSHRVRFLQPPRIQGNGEGGRTLCFQVLTHGEEARSAGLRKGGREFKGRGKQQPQKQYVL